MNELDKLKQLRQEIDRKIARAIYEQKKAWDRNAEKRLSMVGVWYLRTQGLPLDADLNDLPSSFEASLTDKQKIVWERPVDVKKRRGWSWEKSLAKQCEEGSEIEDDDSSVQEENDEEGVAVAESKASTPHLDEVEVEEMVEILSDPQNGLVAPPSAQMSEIPKLETTAPPVAGSHTIVVGTPIQTAITNTRLHAGVHDRDAVKALGARWDDQSKCWYVPIGMDLAPFARWL